MLSAAKGSVLPRNSTRASPSTMLGRNGYVRRQDDFAGTTARSPSLVGCRFRPLHAVLRLTVRAWSVLLPDGQRQIDRSAELTSIGVLGSRVKGKRRVEGGSDGAETAVESVAGGGHCEGGHRVAQVEGDGRLAIGRNHQSWPPQQGLDEVGADAVLAGRFVLVSILADDEGGRRGHGAFGPGSAAAAKAARRGQPQAATEGTRRDAVGRLQHALGVACTAAGLLLFGAVLLPGPPLEAKEFLGPVLVGRVLGPILGVLGRAEGLPPVGVGLLELIGLRGPASPHSLRHGGGRHGLRDRIGFPQGFCLSLPSFQFYWHVRTGLHRGQRAVISCHHRPAT